MGAKIASGEFANNFFHGDVLKKKPENVQEEVAGCFLDKVGAIAFENGVDSFVNDLQVDLAACCTKSEVPCSSLITDAYALLADVAGKKKQGSEVAPQVAAMILNEARKHVKADRV